MHVVLVANQIGQPVMGGDRARLQLRRAFEERGASVEVTTHADGVPKGRDVYVFETPVTNSQVLDADGRVSVLLRHGDCQMASLAPQVIDTPGVILLTPTDYAYRCLGWRVERRLVQWMALEPPALELGQLPEQPCGNTILHVRAFDFQKDTALAFEIAAALPSHRFVFRVHATEIPFSGLTFRTAQNVTLLPPTPNQDDLWRDVGCLLVTSRWESFCMTAYEALGRGIPVVWHDSLKAINEWCDNGLRFLGAHGGGARVAHAMQPMLHGAMAHESVAIATEAHRKAREQFDGLFERLQEEMRR